MDQLNASPADRRIRYGLLGASQIARSAHIPGLRRAENSVLSGIASRSASKSAAWAAEFGIPRSYGSYEEMLADPEIDAVLITLPMHAHCEWVIKAADAGKHILCEKPMATNVAEMNEMVAAALRNNVILMEAFSHRFPPHLPYVRDLLRRGEIGNVRIVRVEVIYPTLDWQNDSRAQARFGGCVTIECGCYCANTLLYFMEADAIDVAGMATQRSASGVDTTFVGILRFPGDRLGMVCASMETKFRASAEIIGDAGRIEIPSLFEGGTIRIGRTNESGLRSVELTRVDRFSLQISHFSDCILNGTTPVVSLQESLDTIKLLDRLKSSQ